MRRSTLVLALLFTALPAGAKDFYIAANQAGNGTGTGCSTVKNLTVADMYVHTSVSDTAVRQTAVNCVIWNNSNNMTITHVTCHDTGWAFAGYGNNFTLSYSNMYNVDHGLAFGAAGTTSGF